VGAATHPLDLSTVEPTDLPLALAVARRGVAVGDRLEVLARVAPSSGEHGSALGLDHLVSVVEAAALAIDEVAVDRLDPEGGGLARIGASAILGLPDHVGPGMRLLSVGLNPSLHSARAGIGYVQGSNRYWKAMLGAGLATVDRDPRHLLEHHGIGMTDLVKRPTPRVDGVRPEEFRVGIDRLDRLCGWLGPGAVVVVGLAGWRAGLDRKAVPGWQDRLIGGRPVYVLPSTSGLNANTSLDGLIAHLRLAAEGP
jgi:TDG/mug DNA glycosylase family protein